MNAPISDDGNSQRSGPRADAPAASPKPTLGEVFGAFFMIGLTGFGGVLPWARRMLVERRGWLTDREFAEVLPLAQLLPGPNVSNIATIIGRKYHGALGAVTGVCGLYLAPTIITVGVGYAYASWGNAAVTTHLLAGLMPVATGLVIATVLKLLVSLPRDLRNLVLVVAMFVAVGLLKLPLLLVLAVLGPFGSWLMWRALRAEASTKPRAE
jgi:chromate transporter